MIFTTLDHADPFAPVLPGLADAFGWLRSVADTPPPAGRRDIDGDRLFAVVEHKTPSFVDPADAVWETHRRYADVQFVASGCETHGWLDRAHAPAERAAYDTDRDATFYAPPPAAGGFGPAPAWFDLPAGHLVVYLPQDVHSPGHPPRTAENGPTVKLVVKLRLPDA